MVLAICLLDTDDGDVDDDDATPTAGTIAVHGAPVRRADSARDDE
jgi:hypothetical protein